jgi:DnaJ-class molecular chaperone
VFIEVRVRPHPLFERDGDHIHIELRVSPPDAALGGTIDLPTMAGKIAIKILLGVNSGTLMRFKGKGIVNQATQRPGDQIVKLKVVLPNAIDKELRDFLERWNLSHPYDVRGKPEGI